MNTILHERQLEGYYCALCYASFDFKHRTAVIGNSGLPYPIQCTSEGAQQVGLPGIPLGLFAGTTYDEVVRPIAVGDVFAFCTDGIFEAADESGEEFGAARLMAAIEQARELPARTIIDAIFEAVESFQSGAAHADDMTVVVLKVTS